MTFATEVLIFAKLLGYSLRILGGKEFPASGKGVEHCDSKDRSAALGFVHHKELLVCRTEIHVASCNGAAPQLVN